MPLYIFCGRHLLAAKLRRSNIDGSAGAVEEVTREKAMGWLGSVDHADRTNERIIASRNFNVRLLGLSNNRSPVADRLFPTLLSKDAYVFVDRDAVMYVTDYNAGLYVLQYEGSSS